MCSDDDIEDLVGELDLKPHGNEGSKKQKKAKCSGTCTGCKTRRSQGDETPPARDNPVQIESPPVQLALSDRGNLRLAKSMEHTRGFHSKPLKSPPRPPLTQFARLAMNIHHDPISKIAAITLVGSTILVASRLALAARR